jgi:hypothetical protein
MKVELAVNQMPYDEVSLQQKKELLLKERSELLVSLHAQQQACAQMEFFRYGLSAPFPPTFRPPPGLSLPSQTAHHVAHSSQKQFTKVCSDDDSDHASTCSGCAESFEAASVSDSIGSTVIMRNIPNRFSQAMLAAVLDKHGFFGMYDLIYVPVDFATGVSFGYAFVNLISAEEAERLMASFDGFKWGGASKKVCGVTLCDDNESPSERVERYRNMPVMHSSVPESFKPAIYSGGQRVPFPAPTKRLRAPRMKKQ